MAKEILTDVDKALLLSLARQSIAHHINNSGELEPSEPQNKALHAPAATFVSLHSDGELRGCIGTLAAAHPLYASVCQNARAAAFGDPRFEPLSEKELEEICIEISVLTEPKEMRFSSPAELLQKLVPGEHGIIIQLGSRSATFLPQVWHELPEKERFLSHLCMKAGLGSDAWQNSKLRVWTYGADVFSESTQ